MQPAIDAMLGALAMGCVFAAVFFARFWMASRDRFFAFFTAALLLLAMNWIGVIHVDATGESRHIVYLLRLLAFVLIAFAVVDKNRRASK